MVNVFTRSGLFGTLLQDEEVAECFSKTRLLAHMRAFERAYTVALAELDLVSAEAATQSLAAIAGARFDPAALAAGSNKDGLPVPTFVSLLRNDLDAEAAKAIHTGATSQDVLDTAVMLTLSDVLNIFEARLSGIIALVDDLTQRFGEQQMMGRTRMQAALPITVGDRLGAWRTALVSSFAGLSKLRGNLAVQLGGAVGRRDMAQGDAVAAILSRELDLPGQSPVWHTDRSRIVEFGLQLVLMTGALGKLGQDIALMAQQGIEEVSITGAGGSSAMPHKQNPVAAELLIALARYVAGQQGILSQSLIHEQERSGQAWALEWLTLPAMAEATGAALNQADCLLSSIERLGNRKE